MPDPVFEIRGEGGAVIQTLRLGGSGLQKTFFGLWASVSSNNKRAGPGPPGPSLDPPLISPHVSESKEFHAVDSGFKVLDSGFFVRETWIPDSRIP